jgi:hypothetical protein
VRVWWVGFDARVWQVDGKYSGPPLSLVEIAWPLSIEQYAACLHRISLVRILAMGI